MRTPPRRIRNKLESGERVFGATIQLACPEAVEIAGYAGLDYVWVDAEHAHLARAAIPVALEDLDGGALARPIGTEQGEGLALLDVEADPSNGLERTVRLPQVTDDDGWTSGGTSAHPPIMPGGGAERSSLRRERRAPR